MITIEGLHKKIGDVVVFDDLNLKVAKGEVLGIRGPSGSGKSTLLRCIQGLEKIDAGNITLQGRSGMIFQQFHLFPHMSVLENITYAPMVVQKKQKDEAAAMALEWLKRVHLENKADHLPHELSGGQKQRIAIVRAMAMDPDILLFDEPTSALDPVMTQEVLTVIKDIATEHKTMMIVSHEEAFLENISTRLITLSNGHIEEDIT